MSSKQHTEIWLIMSELFLDTELSNAELNDIALQLSLSGYSIEQLVTIYQDEVMPVLYPNLISVAGIWQGFDKEELIDLLNKQTKKNQNQSHWLKKLKRLFHRLRFRHHDWDNVLRQLEQISHSKP